jgi:hypothetical protein
MVGTALACPGNYAPAPPKIVTLLEGITAAVSAPGSVTFAQVRAVGTQCVDVRMCAHAYVWVCLSLPVPLSVSTSRSRWQVRGAGVWSD